MPRLIALAAVFAAAGLVCATPAGANAPAVTDPNVSGHLGFCDTSHQQVRSGLLVAAPFAWTTVSSVAAPDGYEKGKASIVGFQPRKDVDPIDWSGKQLNAASTFTNPKHPMASGTRIDSSFSDFTGTYSPQVQGLIQVRMLFTGVNKPMYSGNYPAVFIKVTGKRWTQVGGGSVDCKAGTSRSVELDTLPAARLKLRSTRPSPQTAQQLRALAARGPTGSAASSGRPSTVAAGAPAPTADNAVNAGPAADTKRDDGGSGTSFVWLGGAAVLVALAVGFLVRRRRLAHGHE